MTQFLLVVAVALTVGAVVFGIAMLVTGEDHGMRPVEPDSRAVPLPPDRPLAEPDLAEIRFDTALRGYRMAQVDAALRRAAYDIGYKDELVKVLQAEVDALREGRLPDAEVLRRAREAALAPVGPEPDLVAEPGGQPAVGAAEAPAPQADGPTEPPALATDQASGPAAAAEPVAGPLSESAPQPSVAAAEPAPQPEAEPEFGPAADSVPEPVPEQEPAEPDRKPETAEVSRGAGDSTLSGSR